MDQRKNNFEMIFMHTAQGFHFHLKLWLEVSYGLIERNVRWYILLREMHPFVVFFLKSSAQSVRNLQ